nr:SH3 domain-containing protein 2-like [Ipomoea batatas]
MPTFFRPGQAIEVSRRQAKARESNGNPDYMSKLESAETKLHELKSNMGKLGKLGKEASAAMAAVEAHQQRLTLQRLIAMVEAEYSYHQRVLQILDQLEAEMLSERHGNETVPNRRTSNAAPPPPPYNEASGGFSSQAYDMSADGASYFLGEVTVNLSFAFLIH